MAGITVKTDIGHDITQDQVRLFVDPTQMVRVNNVVATHSDFESFKPQDRTALLIGFGNKNAHAVSAVLRIYVSEDRLSTEQKRLEDIYLVQANTVSATNCGKAQVEYFAETDGQRREERRIERDNWGRTTATFVDRRKGRGDTLAGQETLVAIDAAIEKEGRSKGLDDETIMQMKGDMRRAALGWGFSLADLVSSSKGFDGMARSLAIEATERTKDLLKKLRDAQDDIEKRRLREEDLARLLSLGPATIRAAEEALKIDGVDAVTASLEGHIGAITELHSGNLNLVVPKRTMMA